MLAPSLDYSQRGGANLGVPPFVPASGLQDAGIGFKRRLHDRPWAQDALEVFVSLPTGFPSGGSGFSAGAPTYLAGYSLSFALTANLSLTTTQNVVWAGGFGSYQPSAGFSYALGARGAFLVQDQVVTPASAAGGTGGRVLVALQRALSPNVVVDAEYEINVLPQPGFAQHAFGFGAAVKL